MICAVTGLLAWCEPAYGEDSLSMTLDEIDQQIYLELVKLATFNAHFQLEANHHQPWRRLTYPVGREAGTALTFSATLIDINQQIRGYNNPRRVSQNQLKNAVACGITGNAMSGAASSLELAQNTWVMWQAKKRGFSPRASLALAKDVLAKTEQLLKQREQLVAQETLADKRQALQLETRLARRIRQQLMYEFSTWSAHSRDQAWRENTFYAIDAAQSFTRMGAGILAMRAFDTPGSARPSVISSLVANSLATLNPIVRNLTGLAIRKYQERVLDEALAAKRPEAVATLADFNNTSQWLERAARMAARSENIDANLNREVAQIERFRQIAQQQSISGPLIGLTGVTSSILATEAIFGFSDEPKIAIRLGLAGRITHGTGQAYALINTPYTIVKGFLRDRRLRREGRLPSQLLKERIRLLEAK